jgi:hypothetical protein
MPPTMRHVVRKAHMALIVDEFDVGRFLDRRRPTQSIPGAVEKTRSAKR